MTAISEKTKEAFIDSYPEFEKACHAFFRQELAPNIYKGISGKFGSYAERGAKSGMIRLRFPGGRITRDQIHYLSTAMQQHDLQYVHFTTGQTIQFHHLSGETILTMYKECFDHGIYCIGGGGDNPRNITASPLRGIDPKEYFDISPYVNAASDYALTLIPQLHLPRKYKIGFSNGTDNEGHATFKDLGFLAKENGLFDVYAAGGLGAGNPRLGLKVGENVEPKDILYYVDAFGQIFMAYGDYEHRAKARSRFMPTHLGDKEFYTIFQTYLAESRKKDLDITPEYTKITKEGSAAAASPENPRIHPQRQSGLYYAEYHPIAGTPDRAVFFKVLQYLTHTEGTEIRLNTDETMYIINLTIQEAEEIARLTQSDAAANAFEKSVCCIGASICQQGLRDSHGMLTRLVHELRKDGVPTDVLPQIHISGCPSSCGTHQIGSLGFRGAAKKTAAGMKPAFAVFTGGAYKATQESLGEQAGVITEDAIPAFLTALCHVLEDSGQSFTDWHAGHAEEFTVLLSQFE